jgi:hypothetical protein
VIALVSSGCYNKLPESMWLKQQKFIFSQFGELKFQIKVWQGLLLVKTLFLACRQEFSLNIQMDFPLYVCIKREKYISLPPLIRPQFYQIRTPSQQSQLAKLHLKIFLSKYSETGAWNFST